MLDHDHRPLTGQRDQELGRALDLLRGHARDSGDSIALVFGERRTDYATLDRQASCIANGLIAAGIRPGDRVGLIAKNSDDFIALYYGCAKAATIRRLKEQRPDVDVHLFDVSDMYLPFWEKLTTLNKWATFTPQAQWLTGYFDLITSFYSLEHMPKPAESVDTIAKMLAPDGRFYVVVPDWQTNIADYVVVDHVNHFSPQSLAQLMVRAGLHVEMVKAELHDSALVMVARKPALDQPVAQLVPENLGALEQRAVEVANYWSSFQERVQAFEQCARDAGLAPAIYGSGFYGTYIASCLKNLPAVSCFLDQNPFRQGKTLMGKPIVAPADLPPSVGALYVGLNPARAKTEIEKTQALSQRQLTLFLP